MAKTYDVYIAETMYELVYPNTAGTQRRYIHFENATAEQLQRFTEIANDGGMALAYMANDESTEGD